MLAWVRVYPGWMLKRNILSITKYYAGFVWHRENLKLTHDSFLQQTFTISALCLVQSLI